MVSLGESQRELLSRARRAVLGTTAPDGRPRLVPIAFAFVDSSPREVVLYSALDEKPKSVADPHALARVRDLLVRPRVSVLVDEWNEDWDRLRWLRLDGLATLMEPAGDAAAEHATAVGLLRERYPQYATHHLEDRPIVRIAVERVSSWGFKP
jgi:PPOX class probable F420-dependent enzyme